MFENYHLSENAEIVTKKVPGKKSLELLGIQEKLESSNRSYLRGIPIAFESAKSATVKDVDGNIFIDFLSTIIY